MKHDVEPTEPLTIPVQLTSHTMTKMNMKFIKSK